MSRLLPWQLRAAFAARLSDVYGREVPAYTTLLQVAHEVNADVVEARGAEAERLGSIDRVTAERHGAIRLGTARELGQAATLFAAMGMHPVGAYDLREAASPVPVVSTAFRPVAAEELARNPFRVFTSVLATSDRRFFDAGLQARLERHLAGRELFGPELLELAAGAEADGGLDPDDAERFLVLATAAFELSPEPVDRAWYDELEAVSPVAADIGGVRSTHVNHLTPRVLDIDELYDRMTARGVTMIDDIQGPPRWDGPDVLLRQTSFRALAEPRAFRLPDGTVTTGDLRVRFGEVEARGAALTRAGRAVYDAAAAEVAALPADDPARRRAAAAQVWQGAFPATEDGLFDAGLAYAEHRVVDGRQVRVPIVYEDFLPQSAAGIFASNLSHGTRTDASQEGTPLDEAWLAEATGRTLHDPFELYAAQAARTSAPGAAGPARGRPRVGA